VLVPPPFPGGDLWRFVFPSPPPQRLSPFITPSTSKRAVFLLLKFLSFFLSFLTLHFTHSRLRLNPLLNAPLQSPILSHQTCADFSSFPYPLFPFSNEICQNTSPLLASICNPHRVIFPGSFPEASPPTAFFQNSLRILFLVHSGALSPVPHTRLETFVFPFLN